MAKKKVEKIIKLQIEAGKANPSPPVGPALGQAGLNIMEFCKAFNSKTQDKQGTKLPVVITVYSDKKFDFEVKQPPASALIKKTLNLKQGSTNPGSDIVASINDSQLEEIATTKMPDLNANDMDAAKKIIAGTARSMGIRVEGVN